MLLDANLLLYAVNADSPFHQRAQSWLTDQLNGRPQGGYSLTVNYTDIISKPY
jgi:predicted nucleic acid-binding protein